MSRIKASAKSVLNVLESLMAEGLVAADDAPALAKKSLFEAGEALDGQTIHELSLRNLVSDTPRVVKKAPIEVPQARVRRPKPDFVDEESAAINSFLNKHGSLAEQERNLPALADDYYRTFKKDRRAGGQLVRRYEGQPTGDALDRMLKQMMSMDDTDGVGTNVASAAFRTHYDAAYAKTLSKEERIAYMRGAETRALGNLRKLWNKPVPPKPKAVRSPKSPSSEEALESAWPEYADPPEQLEGVPSFGPKDQLFEGVPKKRTARDRQWDAGGKGLPLSPSNLLGDDKPLLALTKQAHTLIEDVETKMGIRESNIVKASRKRDAAGKLIDRDDPGLGATSRREELLDDGDYGDWDNYRDYAGGSDPSSSLSESTRKYLNGEMRTDPKFETQFLRESRKRTLTEPQAAKDRLQGKKDRATAAREAARALDPIGMVERHMPAWQKRLPAKLFGAMDTSKFKTVTQESLVGAYLDARKSMVRSAAGTVKLSIQAVENRMASGRALAGRMSEFRKLVDKGPQSADQWQKLLVLTHQRMAQNMGVKITFDQAWKASGGGRTLAEEFPIPAKITRELGWKDWTTKPTWANIQSHLDTEFDVSPMGVFDAGTP